MAPGSNKRKRPESQVSQNEEHASRASPHRPENLDMAQRRGSERGRGGRGGGSRKSSRQSRPTDSPNTVPVNGRNDTSPAVAAAPQQLEVPRTDSTPAPDTSRTGSPVQRPAVSAQAPAAQALEKPLMPFDFEYITDEISASWEESGKQALATSAMDADEVTLSVIMQELVQSSLRDRLSPQQAGTAVRRIIFDRQQAGHTDVEFSFLDMIPLLDVSETANPAFRAMLSATDIDPEAIRDILDIKSLENVALVRLSYFARMRNRKTTQILYRQANFNLLREDTEGYAKLITEYFNIVEAASGNNVIDLNVDDAFQRIKALVGAFDLDVGRVLDLTMDVGANALVKSYQFIVKFYRCSSWWPNESVPDGVDFEEPEVSTFPSWALPGYSGVGYTDEEQQDLAVRKQSRDMRFWEQVRERGIEAFFQIGARRISNFDSVADLLGTDIPPTTDSKNVDVDANKRRRMNENRKFMRETKSLPPPGNPDAAQLLGFKLRFYASSARDADDVLPENLIHFTALLIKTGFISLRDLYPHLYPSDESMPQEREWLEKEKAKRDAKERPGGAPNALATASALTDDTAPTVRSLRAEKDRSGGATPKVENDETSKEDLPKPTNQKIALLKALLTIGALPEALFILGRFPWLLDVDWTLPPYLHRIVKRMLSMITEETPPLSDRSDRIQSREQIADTAAVANGTLPRTAGPSKRPPMKWLQLEGISRDGVDGRYYYSDWDECIPVCQTVEDVVSLCNTFIGYLGPKIGQDHVVYGTLLRVARQSLTRDSSEANRARWLEIMKRLLVPASSFSKHNPGLTDELYQLLMFYPITTRYAIYAEWFTGRTSRQADVKNAFDYNRAEVKEVLRRVSNDNVKWQARALGKVSYSSPGVLIMYMINQLESYSNLIPALVDCTKYFPKLAYDVLTWCLISSLSGTGRDRMQADGMLTSSWLQALSQFVASLFYRYSDVNPSPIMQYLASELRKGESTDLEMFEQVLAEMAGIRSDLEFNDQQVLAMAGGEVLQAQVVQQLADTRHARKSSAKRLIRALSEPNLIGQTLISIAQERQMYAHHESSKFMPLKVLGNNLDKIQQIFAQYLEVLRTNLKPEEYEAAVPDVATLIEGFGLQPGMAFTICRSAIAHRVNEYDEAKKLEGQERKKRRASKENQDVEMQEADANASVKGEHDTDEADGSVKPKMLNGDSQDTPAPTSTPQPSAITNGGDTPWHPILLPIIKRLPEVTGDLKERTSIEFYVFFWTLALPDVVAYPDSYGTEIDRLNAQIKEINRDRSSMATNQVQERDRKKKALAETVSKLQSEVKNRVGSWQKVSNRITHREKSHWFDRSRDRGHLDARHAALLQECFLPRAMMSSLDAQYCFLIFKILHEKGAPGFSTLHLMAQLFRKQELAALIFQCTANEAQHLGRFLNETLKLLGTWHSKKEAYEKDALGSFSKNKLPGFAIGPIDYDDHSQWTWLDYETFRRQLFNWHVALTSALQLCFESGEYSHIRNGIIVLKAVVQNFPQVNFQGKGMIAQVDKLSKEDSRQDLKLMALSLLGPLKNREKSWVLPQAFRLNDPSKDGRASSRAPSARAETPSAAAGTPKLNAAAPEFKPNPAVLAEGARKGASNAGIEDGEVEDAKPATTTVPKAADVDANMPDSKQGTGSAPSTKDASVTQALEEQAATTSKAAPASNKSHDKSESRTESGAPTAASANQRSQSRVNGSARHESSRPQSTQPAADNNGYGLPDRPASRTAARSDKPLPPPPVARPEGRFPTRHEQAYGRLDRPSDVRADPRDQSPGYHGRTREPLPAARGPSREERPRPSRDGSWASSRQSGPPPAVHPRPSDNRDNVNGSMGPPTGQPHPERAGFLPSVASAPASREGSRPGSSGGQAANEPSGFVNPERQRLIEAQNTRGPGVNGEKGRRDRESRDDRGAVQPPRAETRSNGRGPAEAPRRDQPTEHAPSGPRHARSTRERDVAPSSESSYGRLNAPSETTPVRGPPPNGPSGPRSGRNFTAPQPDINARSHDNGAPPPHNARPTDPPAGNRHQSSRQSFDGRAHGSQHDRQPASITGPPASAAENGPSVHPSRMQNVQPPPIQTNVSALNGPQSASSPTTAPPSGPRGSGRPPLGAPTGPSPVTATPPSGPAAVDRQRSTRQYASINAQISQNASSPNAASRGDVSFRGASTRQNSFGGNGPAPTGPAVHSVASPMEPPQSRRLDAARQDGTPSRPSSRAETGRELFQGSEARDGGRGHRNDAGRQRGSRDPSRHGGQGDDQPPQRPPPPGMDAGNDRRGPQRDERRMRDDRERMDPAANGMRGPQGPRENGRPRGPGDGQGHGAFPGQPQPPQWARDDGQGPRRESGRTSGRAEDFRGGRREDDRRQGGGRGPGMGEEAPADGRKRRHEGPNWDPEGSKRRRSNR